MAKSKRNRKRTSGLAFGPEITPEQQREWAAESFARTIVDTSPEVRKMRTTVEAKVKAIATKALRDVTKSKS